MLTRYDPCFMWANAFASIMPVVCGVSAAQMTSASDCASTSSRRASGKSWSGAWPGMGTAGGSTNGEAPGMASGAASRTEAEVASTRIPKARAR